MPDSGVPPRHSSDPRVAPRGAASSSAPPAENRSREINPHLSHVRQHLESIRNGVTHVDRPERIYLGNSNEESFWELVGFRLSGHPAPVLAAVRFHRLERPGVDHGRESLATFLSAPSRAPGLSTVPGAFPVLLPRAHETIPRFLSGLRAGRRPAPVFLETIQIELAFDFRLRNPAAVEALRHTATPLSPHLFRTARGHVIRARCHGPGDGRNRLQRFLPVRDPFQLTPSGRAALPALVLNRSFVTLVTGIEDRETDLAAANWVPFASASAAGAHLILG